MEAFRWRSKGARKCIRDSDHRICTRNLGELSNFSANLRENLESIWSASLRLQDFRKISKLDIWRCHYSAGTLRIRKKNNQHNTQDSFKTHGTVNRVEAVAFSPIIVLHIRARPAELALPLAAQEIGQINTKMTSRLQHWHCVCKNCDSLSIAGSISH